MKDRKLIVPTLAPRNPFVLLALEGKQRKGGAHSKPYKSQRKLEKQRGYNSTC